MRVAGSIQEIDYTLYNQELDNSDRLPERMISDDRLLKHGLRPNTSVVATTSDFSVLYRINSKGIRDEEHVNSLDRSVSLAFGDSMTFGEGVPHSKRFTEVIERKKDVQVLNYGMPGYGIDQSLLQYYRDGNRSADNVYLFLDTAMLYRNKTPLKSYNLSKVVKNAGEVESNSPGKAKSFEKEHSTFLDNSYLLSYLSYRYKAWKLQEKMRKHDKELWSSFNGPSSNKPGVKIIKKRSMRLVNKFDEIAERRGHDLKVVNIGLSNLSYLNTSEINYYSLKDELKDRGENKNLRFTYDPHYNSLTHRFIGGKLSNMQHFLE